MRTGDLWMVDLSSHLFDICYRDLLEVRFIAVERNVKITCAVASWRLPQPGTFPTQLSVMWISILTSLYVSRDCIICVT